MRCVTIESSAWSQYPIAFVSVNGEWIFKINKNFKDFYCCFVLLLSFLGCSFLTLTSNSCHWAFHISLVFNVIHFVLGPVMIILWFLLYFFFSQRENLQVTSYHLYEIDLHWLFRSPKLSSKCPMPFEIICCLHEWYSIILLFGVIHKLRYRSNYMHLFWYWLIFSEIPSVQWNLFINVPLR